MIGQEALLNDIVSISRFTIITGAKGQGKKTLAKEIANKFHFELVEVGIKVDDIRYMIDNAYKQTGHILYLIADADDMSVGAKNSLLKVIEEPPQQAYFIMTLEQIENTLPTIISRCHEIKMQQYSTQEKQQMINELLPNATQEEILILDKFNNYGQMQQIVSYGIKDFYNYVEKVYKNIYVVPSANVFKLTEKLDLKNEGNGYDLELFFMMYIYFCAKDLFDFNTNGNWFDKRDTLESCIELTHHYKQQLNIKGINKQMLIDMWILNIRKEWLQL